MHAPSNGNGRSASADDRTLIMGAGPGGLCSAYVLSKAGVPATVVEKAPFVGGLARTIRRQTEHGEFKFDIGGHRWFTKNDELNELFQEVVAEELLWVNRISRIYFDGKYVDYPLKISNALKAIGPVTAAQGDGRLRPDPGRSSASSPTPVESMEDAYIDQFGPTLYELFFQALLGEGLGPALRPDERRLGLPALQGHVARDRGQGRGRAVQGQGRQPDRRVHVPAGRVRALLGADGRRHRAAWATRSGSSAGVEKVHREGNRVDGVTVSTENGAERIEADNFISSIPLTLLAKIMDPAPPAEVLAAADALTFRNIITVNLMLKKRQVTPDTWLYVHDRNILFGRFHEPKNWSPAMVPSDDYTSLVVEYFCSFGDHIWYMSEEQLVEQTVKHLVEDLEVHHAATRSSAASPCGRRGPTRPTSSATRSRCRRSRTSSASSTISRSSAAYGTFRYNNTDHSIETGLLAAKNMLGERHDLDQVNADEEYHEIKRVPEAAGVGGGR